MPSKINFGINDNSNELSSFSIAVDPITDGAAYDAAVSARGNIALILASLSLGVINTQSIGVTESLSKDRATSPWANRENAVVFTMQNVGGNLVKASLPCPDLDKFPFADLGQDTTPVPYTGTHADVQLLITALETYAVHPIVGDALTVIRMDYVGRSN